MSEKKPCILVVDDEEAIRRFLRVTLTSQGYEIIEAASGQEAISSVKLPATGFNYSRFRLTGY